MIDYVRLSDELSRIAKLYDLKFEHVMRKENDTMVCFVDKSGTEEIINIAAPQLLDTNKALLGIIKTLEDMKFKRGY